MRHALTLLVLMLAACAAPAFVSPQAEPATAARAAQEVPALEPREVEPAAPVHSARRIVVTTGVHGNEPSGWLVQASLAERGFIVFGPCNPWGIRNGKRWLEDGRDLNRLFADARVEPVKAVHDFLAQARPELLLDLHEDPDGMGAYLIQNGPASDLGARIVKALRGRYEFDPAPQWSVIKGENGLIKPDDQTLRLQAFTKIWSLAFYAHWTYRCTAFTVECPGSWPEAKRKRYQLDVCETARRLFLEKP